MPRKVLSVFAGLLAGFVVVYLVELVSNALYPMPDDLDTSDVESLKAYVASLPAPAFAIVWLAHFAGAFAAGLTCVLVSRDMWRVGPIILGILLLSFGATNLVMIPHPPAFAVADVLVYIPAALLGGRVAYNLSRATGTGRAEVDA